MSLFQRLFKQIMIILVLTIGTFGVANAALDYCWKDSYGRGVGTIPNNCPAGMKKEGALCYRPCEDGYESSTLGACLQKCKPGYRNDGLFCRKAEYHVEEFPWQFSDPLDDSGMWDRCKARYGANGCEKRGAVVVQKCQAGETHILGFCRPPTPDCKAEGYAGQFDLSCTKNTYFKKIYEAQCASDQEIDAGLCYKTCAAGSYGVGPVCWNRCPTIRGSKWVECGAGCSASAAACASNTTDMVLSVLDAAVSIASLGTASGGISAIKNGVKEGATEGIKAVAKQYGKSFSNSFTKGWGDLGSLSGRVQKGIDAAQLGNNIQAQTRTTIAFVGGVQEIVGKDISQAEMDFQIAQLALGTASLLDPSGVLGIAAAYTKPVCSLVSAGSEETHPTGPAELMMSDPNSLYSVIARRLDLLNSELTVINAMRAEAKAATDNFHAGMQTSYASKREPLEKSFLALERKATFYASRMTDAQKQFVSAELDVLKTQLDRINGYLGMWGNGVRQYPEPKKTQYGHLMKTLNNFNNEAAALAKERTEKMAMLRTVIADAERLAGSGAPSTAARSVTAAITAGNNLATYLFYSDGSYARSSSNVAVGFDAGYPTNMPGGWKGIPSGWQSGINAGLPYRGTAKGYMWSSGDYLRLNGFTVDAGYPIGMPGGWRNMPAGWSGQVDAALYFPPWDKHYFFKGNEYVRLTGVTVDAGYPAKLPGGWQGMPTEFSAGIDAATFRNGHVYMIKGDYYIRFTGTKVDAGYPKPMSRWPE
ncbi:hemopexin repeat-containing protein [Marinobacter caseinilyticus]|uniref:hemopexin repeat-containing protein n=1 Tax=Marinobacter caseinilyticus TaxID=2692195 RepID=UPI001408CD4D|nr:hemopexin repeat-containing protein [Marinobacter caseinilyticus]